MPLGILFVWDRRKAAANLRKHDVSFEEAAQIFGDPLLLTVSDREHSEREERFFSIGQSWAHRLIAVSHQESGNKFVLSAREKRRGGKRGDMRKAKSTDAPEMPAEIDFSGGERGRYAKRFAEGTNLVMLEPDVAEAFPDSESVNAALRVVLRASVKAGQQRKSRRRAG